MATRNTTAAAEHACVEHEQPSQFALAGCGSANCMCSGCSWGVCVVPQGLQGSGGRGLGGWARVEARDPHID